jgi:hypothetical protein
MTGSRVKGRKWLAAVSLVLGLVVAGVLAVNHRRVGRVLDAYRGVPVYDNGLLSFRSYGRHYSPDGGSYLSLTRRAADGRGLVAACSAARGAFASRW